MFNRREMMKLAAAFAVSGMYKINAQEHLGEDSVPSKFPGPRWPSYVKEPRTIEEVMPLARALAQNPSGEFGGSGLGVLQPGESALIVIPATAETLIIEAVRKAVEERGVKLTILTDFGLVGVSKADALAFSEAIANYPAEGFSEVRGFWIEHFGLVFTDPDAPKRWLEKKRPDLFAKLYPQDRELSAHLKEVQKALEVNRVGKAIREYLEQHPEIRGVFWGKMPFWKPTLRSLLGGKQLGVFMADNHWEMMSEIPNYPSDLWLLLEEKTIASLAFVDKVHVTDPEGTDVSFELTEEQADRWAKGVYERGHLLMYPDCASGQFPSSVTDFPQRRKEWIPREPIGGINGVVAGTTGHHGGFFPRMEVHYRDGYIQEVKGGGIFGEVFREFMKYPNTNDLPYPFYDSKHPGFWRLFEIAVCTHPKYYRSPEDLFHYGAGEYHRSGVVHWGVGADILNGPPEVLQKWREFGAKYNVPIGHDFHIQNYFTTYSVHLRHIDTWITLVDKGHLTALDDPDVRALAARRGDAGRLLSEDWIPEMPGINAPGSYTEYANDPWKYVKTQMDEIVAGTYQHYYPRRSGGD
ncbi:MAG: hypothetical protein M3N22_01300 [Acidobacteriota bacterium]|nr:hypothetical protein [Acidobacteriota bacterium]